MDATDGATRGLPRWAVVVLLLGLSLSLRGYQSREGDQAYRLPLLLHHQDPTLFASDPFVRTFDDFNPHAGFVDLMDAASRPLGLSAGLLGIYLATFVADLSGGRPPGSRGLAGARLGGGMGGLWAVPADSGREHRDEPSVRADAARSGRGAGPGLERPGGDPGAAGAGELAGPVVDSGGGLGAPARWVCSSVSCSRRAGWPGVWRAAGAGCRGGPHRWGWGFCCWH